jgi:flagellar basal-body rod modification protein FlgD
MNSVDAYQGLGLSTSAGSVLKKNSLGQEQFLKLMTAQLTHQDPTKPMQNGEFLSQMAQFGTVSGIQDLQQSFKNFSTSISSDQALQAASLVGRFVSVPSEQGLLAAGGEIKGTVDLPASSSNVNLKILDPITGDVVAIKSLGGHTEGSVPFVWDGINSNGVLANPGVYKVQVETGIDGTNTVLQPEIQSRVESVSMDSGKNGLQVNLMGLGTVNFNQIKHIL